LTLSSNFEAPICSAKSFVSSSQLNDIATIVAPPEISFGLAASASSPWTVSHAQVEQYHIRAELCGQSHCLGKMRSLADYDNLWPTLETAT
jgi:hypothetical protein